jgi:hypothetical protein
LFSAWAAADWTFCRRVLTRGRKVYESASFACGHFHRLTAKRLIPYRFTFFTEQVRATQSDVDLYRQAAESAQRNNAEIEVVETFHVYQLYA